MRREEEIHSWQIVGPLFALAAFSISASVFFTPDLVLCELVGLFLCARWPIRGCIYGWGILLAIGAWAHFFGESNHLFRLGLEAALACSLLITALSFERNALAFSLQTAQLSAKESAVENLETQMSQMGGQMVAQEAAACVKREDLERRLEEAQAEKGALEVLNDVLRKAHADYRMEKQAAEEQRDEEKQRFSEMLGEMEELREERARWRRADAAAQNRELLHELNAARIAKEQTCLINETLVRMHAKESHEAAKLSQAWKEMQSERQERSLEMAALKKEKTDLEGRLKQAEDQIYALTQAGLLYPQLQRQFEEKKQILQATRKALFQSETELQMIRMEKEERLEPIPSHIYADLDRASADIGYLEEEVKELQEIVTQLMHPPAPSLDILRGAFSGKKKAPSLLGELTLEETLRAALKKKAKAVKNPVKIDKP